MTRIAPLCLLLLLLTSCAVEHGAVYVKDGKEYGRKPGLTWRGRWWDYYQRGTSYVEGEFWQDALADFQAALQQRQADQRTARTYGLHFLDYFPHRESGVAYYRLGRYAEAIGALETSLHMVDSARAKFYLNKARQAQLQHTGRDTLPPRIVFEQPTDGMVTRQLRLPVTGRVEDDTYVAAVAINGQARFIELAEPRMPFAQEIALSEGPNRIEVTATDLTGRRTRQSVTVYADRRGPLLSVERIEVSGSPLAPRVRLRGVITDDSRVQRFVLGRRQIPLPPESEWEFDEEVLLSAGTEIVPFEVEDTAGNVTRGEIPLTVPAPGPPGTREGRPVLLMLPRWAAGDTARVLSDLIWQRTAQQRPGLQTDRQPPVIHLSGFEPQQPVYANTVYLEVRITDASAITGFTINGESFWRRKGIRLFFGILLPLHSGENRLRLEAVDEAGNVAQREVVVTYQVPEIQKLASRLRVAILPAIKVGETQRLSSAVDALLTTAFGEQKRFQLVERERLDAVLLEKLLSLTVPVDQDAAARNLGKIAAAEGVVVATVIETPQALEVAARFVDVESNVIMAVVDVYGEDPELRDIRTLMDGMAWKFQQKFPLVQGVVIQRDGKHVLVDRGEKHALQKYMKAIVFREGNVLVHPVTGKPLRTPAVPLGEVRLEAVAEETARATLLQGEQAHDVKESDQFITK